jgi:hypothetical protein
MKIDSTNSNSSLLVVVCASLITSHAVAQEWYPSIYGQRDEIGAANNLGESHVLEAANLIQTGKVYSLAVELNSKWPAIRGRAIKLDVTATTSPLGPNKLTAHDDKLTTHMALGTSVDGLAHVGIDFRYYNGLKEEDIFTPNGLKKLGLHAVPPIVTRGILLDMARYFGVKRLAVGTEFNSREIEAAANMQGINIGKGDVVLFHTGWMDMLESDPERYMSEQPGLGKNGAQYLADAGVVLVGSDSRTLEVQPYADDEVAPVHQILLAKNGVYILEHVKTEELAVDQVYEFLFVMAAPKIEGSVQSIVHPVAIK